MIPDLPFRSPFSLLAETRMPDPAIVRFAVIDLGHFAQTAILPTFANAIDGIGY